MKSFADIQKDHVSLAAQEILPILRTATPKSDRAKHALDMLARWNGSMDVDRVEPLIYNAWMRAISYRLFADELGEPLMKDYWEQRNVHQPTVNVLQNKDGQGKWCADVSKRDEGTAQTCAELLSVSLETALSDLEQRYGKDMGAWSWGKAHEARSEHRPFGKVDMLAKFFDIRVPSPGDTFTVNVGRHNLRDEKEPFTNRHAASLRALYDLSNLENSRFIHSTGQSGNVFSSFYRNYSQRWVDVEYLPMKMRREDVQQDKLGLLTLSP